MPYVVRQALYVLVLLAFVRGIANADDHPVPSYPDMLLEDARHVLSSPARWQKTEWKNLGYATLGIVGIGMIADRPVMDWMRRQPRDNRFMLRVERFGAEYAVYTVAGFYLAGLAGNQNASAVAQDAIAASLIASGIITPALKFVTGRARPRENLGTATFHPLNLGYSTNSSFPSGHTTEAFALASVIANHYEETWVTCASYSIAGLVGLARMYHDAHFASDVAAGALIGTLVGKSVVRHNQSLRTGTIVVTPEISTSMAGFRLTRFF